MRKVPSGFSIVTGIVVHAEGIGHERLAEQGAMHPRFELELEEVVLEEADDFGWLQRPNPPGLPMNRSESSPGAPSAPSLPPIKLS